MEERSAAAKKERWIDHPMLVFVGIWMGVMTFIPRSGQARFAYLAVHYLLFPLVLAGCALARRLKNKRRCPFQGCKMGWGGQEPRSHWTDLAMVSYLAVIAISAVTTGEHWATKWDRLIAVYREVFIPFTVYWLVRFRGLDVESLRVLSPLMLLFGLGECAIGLLSWFAPQTLSGIWIARVEQHGGPRVVGSFTQPDVYSGALVLFAVFAFQYALVAAGKWLKVACLVLFNVSLFCVLLSFSRASWLSGSLVLVVLACLYRREFLFFVLPGLLASILLLKTVLAPELEYAARRFETAETIGNRVIAANAGARMLLGKPLLGWGYGTYDTHDRDFVENVGGYEASDWDREVSTSHNTYLTILAESGIIGLALYLVPAIWWFIITCRRLKRLPRSAPKAAFFTWRFFALIWALLLFFATIGQLIDLSFCPFALTVQWLLLALVANFAENHLLTESSHGG